MKTDFDGLEDPETFAGMPDISTGRYNVPSSTLDTKVFPRYVKRIWIVLGL